MAGAGALLVLSACAPVRLSPNSHAMPAVARVQEVVQGEIHRRLPMQQTAMRAALAALAHTPPPHAQALVLQGLTDPWAGLDRLERRGLQFASVARSEAVTLMDLIGLLGITANVPVASVAIPPAPTAPYLHTQLDYLTSVLLQAGQFRERALRTLKPAEREFLFAGAAAAVERFAPQVAADEPHAQTIETLRRFTELTSQIDQTALLAAAQALARLADDQWLEAMEAALADQPVQPPPPGITGEVLLVRESAAGLIVIGGRGPNRYRLDGRVALVLDLGGDDLYEGAIAAPASKEQGISLVIDVAGNDTYRPAPLGLATGRLGIGLLIDRFGNDTYELAPGSGGTGFAGIGLLDDREGHDRYVGNIFTQGAGLGGMGLLVDRLGNDTFGNFGYGLGFGAPEGLGVLLDLEGDDQYECGEHLVSSYDAGEPGSQYDCFGLGAGAGFRIVRQDGDRLSFEGLAGGIGLLMDLAGDDRYRSANFSQGAGYFFGAGFKLDGTGNDQHQAARYGLGAAAHGAVGLHVDYEGYDRYGSTGPFYNCGAAWDRSLALCLDAGAGDDRYELSKSDGLGLADHQAWGMFLDEAGDDSYLAPRGLGMALHESLGVFFDLAGDDVYASVPRPASGRRDNGEIVVDQAGGLFEDR
jgi:hypothetical protein